MSYDPHCEKHHTFQSVCSGCQKVKKNYWLQQVRTEDEADTPKPPLSVQHAPAVSLPSDPVIDLCMRAAATRPTSETLLQFLEYHRKNPSIYDYMVAALYEMKDANYRRYGFPMVFNQCRWHFGVKQRNSDFELNNNIAAHYSRAIAILNPELEGFYEMRTTENGTADPDFGYTPKKADQRKGQIA